jgi:predicted GIY-YIG superfamily endonuclease
MLYVLKLEDDCYYVGKTEALKHRLGRHFSGQGASWTRLHKPVSVVDIREETADLTEKDLTIEVMKAHGFENVRGAGWSISTPGFPYKCPY